MKALDRTAVVSRRKADLLREDFRRIVDELSVLRVQVAKVRVLKAALLKVRRAAEVEGVDLGPEPVLDGRCKFTAADIKEIWDLIETRTRRGWAGRCVQRRPRRREQNPDRSCSRSPRLHLPYRRSQYRLQCPGAPRQGGLISATSCPRRARR